ncbi:MAG: DUF4124 domain-containing protein [Gammaproteobacteria bacterium]|nr:DUF4124 domain-containing protein [Gammaproteobacteria bacterium]MCP5201715.1 DUF4124 domain-containing protein [Gammaproteobacteria bacterium]
MPHLVRLIVIACCCAALPALAGPEVYRWIDGDGNVVFSDTPVEGAEKIEIQEPTVVPSRPVPRPVERLSPPAPTATYEALSIVSPADQATIRNQREVAVSVAVQPGLDVEAGHRVQFYFDGNPYGAPARLPQTTISELERGQHSVGAAIIDGNGKELIRAEPVVIFVHLPSKLHPAPKV